MTEADTYNGWANYETWAVALHIDNDRGTYETARDFTREAVEDVKHPTSEYWTVEQSTRFYLADYLKDWVTDDLMPELDGMACDLLAAALSEVDWNEIAAHYIADHEPSEAAV